MKRPIYKTKQRETILEGIAAFGEAHFTAADALAKVRETGAGIAQSTVYRELERLTDEGLLKKFEHGSGSACYQMTAHEGCAEHFHLKCAGCSALIHVDCDFMRQLEEHVRQHHSFALDKSRTVLYGRCDNCAGGKL